MIENQPLNVRENPEDNFQKKKIGLPVTALALDIASVIIYYLYPFLPLIWYVSLLSIILFPVAGIILGIISLCKGRKRVGAIGMVLSIAAIVLPIVFPVGILALLTLAVGLSM